MFYRKLLLLLLVSTSSAFAQNWSGILDRSRAVDWTNAGIPGGIPVRTTACSTVAPSGLTDATDMNAIDAALAACPPGQFVQLQAGAYTITNGLTFGSSNYITLRGAGPDKTILKMTGFGNHECGGPGTICMNGNSSTPSLAYAGSHLWTGTAGANGTYTQGATILNLDSVSGIAVGQILMMDQRNDDIGMLASPNGITENGCTSAPCTVTVTTSIPHGYSVGQTVGIGGKNSTEIPSCAPNCMFAGYEGWYRITAVPSSRTFQYTLNTANLAPGGTLGVVTKDTNGLFVSGNRNADLPGQDLDQGRTCPDLNSPATCQAGEISFRTTMEVKVVTSVDAANNQITIFPGLYYPSFRTSQAPGVWWLAATSGSNPLSPSGPADLTGGYAIRDGLEDLTVDNTPQPTQSAAGGIELRHAYQCWVKNVRSLNGNRNHVWVRDGSMQNVIRDNYFFGQKGAGSQSYGVEHLGATANELVENNIFQHIVAGIMSGGSVGSVFSYNYMLDDGSGTPGLVFVMLNSNHDVNAYNLFEGNNTPSVNSDNTHGSANLSTYNRNRFRGQSLPIKNNGLLAVSVDGYNRAQNFVGNVLGTTGTQVTYQQLDHKTSGFVWAIGATLLPCCGLPGVINSQTDPLTLSSLLRWGNIDVVTGAARWCGTGSESNCGGISEVPTTGIPFINGNAVPVSHALPASFYLSAQPFWWPTPFGVPQFPPYGPDVIGGTAPDGFAGFADPIPSQFCYNNTPIDNAYQTTYDITGASWVSTGGGTATFILNTGTNVFSKFQTITIGGITPPSFNGTFEISAVTANTISVLPMKSDPGPYASGGKLAGPNILAFNANNCYSASLPLPPTNLRVTGSATIH